MLFTNQWRMSLQFLISGLAVNFVWNKYSAGQFSLRRIWRLLVTLLFGLAFIVSAQCYYPALNKEIIEPGYLIARDDGFWAELKRMRWITLILGVVFFALYILQRDLLI